MVVRGLYTWALDHDGVLLFLTRAAARHAKARSTAGRTWTHTRSAEAVLGAHAVEFSKTAAPSARRGISRRSTRGRRKQRPPDERRTIAPGRRPCQPAARRSRTKRRLPTRRTRPSSDSAADVHLADGDLVERDGRPARSGGEPPSARSRTPPRSAAGRWTGSSAGVELAPSRSRSAARRRAARGPTPAPRARQRRSPW